MLTTTQLQGLLPAGIANLNSNLRLNVNPEEGAEPIRKEKEQVIKNDPQSLDMLIVFLAQILLEPYEYLISNPGKDVRSKMIDAFNVWLQVPEDDLLIITKVIGMLHSASLLYVPS